MPREGETKWARELNRPDSRGNEKLVWRVCQECAAGKWVRFRKVAKLCFKCLLRNRRGDKHPSWKGGRNREGFGYISVQVLPGDKYYEMTKKNGYVMEHRLVMAHHLNRPLDKQEIVHHLNGIRNDNRRENLALVDRRTHPHRTMVQLQQVRITELERQLKELQ